MYISEIGGCGCEAFVNPGRTNTVTGDPEAGDEAKARGEPLAPDYERRLSRSSACNDERAELVQSNDQRGVPNRELATRPHIIMRPGACKGRAKNYNGIISGLFR